MGLLIKREIDYSIPETSIFQSLSDRAEALLGELHMATTGDIFANMMPVAPSAEKVNPFTSGSVLREAIFYGGESAYSFQYRDLLERKYRRDDDWLMANKGFSIHNGQVVVKAVGAILNDRLPDHGTGNPILPPQRPFNLLVRLVLTQRIHRPDGRGHPADQRDLQNQANNPRNGTANGEKHQKWQKNR